MSKNLNKIVAFAIGVSIFTGSIVPAMADTVSNSNVNNSVQATSSVNNNILTLDDAIKAAIDKSDKLKLYDEKIRYLENKKSLNDKRFNFLDEIKSDKYDEDLKDYSDDLDKATVDQVEQQRDFEKDSLTYKTTDSYNNLIAGKLEIEDKKKDINIKERKLNDNKLKQQLGLVTDIEIEGAELDLQKDKNSLKNCEDKLKDLKDHFKVLTGKNVDDYVLDERVNYEKFQIEGSEDEYIDSVIDQYFYYNQQLIEISKKYWDDSDTKDKYKLATKPSTSAPTLKATGENGEVTDDDRKKYDKDLKNYQNEIENYISSITNRLTYLETKYNLKENQNTIDEAKKNLKDGLKSMYTAIKNIESSIDLLNNTIELKNKQVKIAKTQYDLGLSTKLDYDKAVNEYEALDSQMRSLIVKHDQLKQQIQKPWLISSDSSKSES